MEGIGLSEPLEIKRIKQVKPTARRAQPNPNRLYQYAELYKQKK